MYVNVIARVCSLHFDSSDYEKPMIQRMLKYSPKHQRKLKPNAVPSKNLPRIQKPTIKCKPVNTHTPHSTHDGLFQASFQSSKLPKEKNDPFTSNNNNNCLNDLPDFGVQLLSETQDVGIQCEIGMVYSGLPVERADVSTQCGNDLNEVEKYEKNTNNY
ncbi:unnamed protein product [Macrosiphum euphorbiae]|uniref:THAP-type domain-containing protein n=1 Tax=Macrosiphum euphorbiae TaxID=13131 RepID=A0AAV0VT95_9HEMI|nr:unnamed protein product [Macrosiphum euphorbiae]CAI6352026.1 unnamed protein product [Macrosiphum euphorbiae]